MKCINKKIIIEGIVSSKEMSINKLQALECIVTNDKKVKHFRLTMATFSLLFLSSRWKSI